MPAHRFHPPCGWFRSSALRALPLAISGLLVAKPGTLLGQDPSERGTVTQSISGTEISIDYARPSARGRSPVFGGIVHFGEVWTPGANDNTKIRFSRDVTLNGHEVPAGTYGVWMEVAEGQEWTFMLHSDTTLFHIPHPSLSDGFLNFPIAVDSVPEFEETISFDFQHLRYNGATIVMRWGVTRASLDLGVDPGFDLTVDPEVARRYVGDWVMTQIIDWEDPEVVEMMAGMEAEEQARFRAWFTPAALQIVFDPESGQLKGFEELPQGLAELDEPMPSEAQDAMGPESERFFWMLPRAEGIFAQAYPFQGEVGWAWAYLEFAFDGDGQAVSFDIRDRESDERMGTGVRAVSTGGGAR